MIFKNYFLHKLFFKWIYSGRGRSGTRILVLYTHAWPEPQMFSKHTLIKIFFLNPLNEKFTQFLHPILPLNKIFWEHLKNDPLMRFGLDGKALLQIFVCMYVCNAPNRIQKGPFFLKIGTFLPPIAFSRITFGLKNNPCFLISLVAHVYNTSISIPLFFVWLMCIQYCDISVHILKSKSSMTSIVNRASRALANLAEDPHICTIIHNSKAVPLLVKLVREQDDSNCRQSLVRAVRILASNDKRKWEVIKNEGECPERGVGTDLERGYGDVQPWRALFRPLPKFTRVPLSNL